MNRQISPHTLGRKSPHSIFHLSSSPSLPSCFAALYTRRMRRIAEECQGLSSETAVFVSEPVNFTAEVRTFVLGGVVLDAAVYEGKSEVTGAVEFVGELTRSMPLPRTVVVDVGFIDRRGWGVIEFNPAWGAGLNGCDPEKVLPAIVVASQPIPDSPAKN